MGCGVVGLKDSENNTANFCSRSCARVRARIVVLEENLLNFRTTSSNRPTYLQFFAAFQCGAQR
jgi:hypothetical protein